LRVKKTRKGKNGGRQEAVFHRNKKEKKKEIIIIITITIIIIIKTRKKVGERTERCKRELRPVRKNPSYFGC
jgi:hypothetical protein